jgi:hypothetical protein
VKRFKPIDWDDDAQILKLGKAMSRCALNFANELVSYGADLDRLRHPYSYQDLPNDGKVCIPAESADLLLAVLLSLPRLERGRRPKTLTREARQLVAEGKSKRGAAQMTAKTAGESAENIRRRLRPKRRSRN